MSDFAGLDTTPLPPPHLSIFSQYGIGEMIHDTGGTFAPGSSTFTTANYARYYPMSLPWPYLVRRVWWINGSSATGNRNFGIYTRGFAQIYATGSTAASGASSLQYVTPGSPILLQPGEYYFAFNCSATTNAVWGKNTGAADQIQCGILQQNVGSVSLPDPMVPITPSAASVALCGVTWTTSGFA